MEKSSKKEYIAVPTSDVEAAALPAYEETDPTTTPKSQKRKNVRFLLIGGAIALLGLTHLCTSNYMSEDSIFAGDALAQYEDREPCALKHLEQYNELKEHMADLKTTFGVPHHHEGRPDFEHLNGLEGPPPHHGEHKKHGHKHHKHHKGKKHHNDPTPPPPPPSDELSENMWVEDFDPHHKSEPVPPPPPHHRHGKDHHKEHKHKHHKGKKHHDEPAPPPPAKALMENEWVDVDSSPVSDKDLAIEGHKKKHHKKHPHKPFCNVKKLEATSTVFNFSPEEFQRTGVFLNGYFSRGGHVRLSKSDDKSVTDVKVTVTLYTGREDLKKEVKLSAFDHEGQYAVQIERGHFKGALPPTEPPHDDPPQDGPEDEHVHIHKHHKDHDDEDQKQENCLVYNVDIEFPSNIDYFEDVQLHIKSAQRIEGGSGLDGMEFGTVKAGLGHGAIIFDGLKAKKLLLGVINGVVMGTYQPGETFAAGVIRGAAKVNIEPTGENVNITASSTFGPASVDIPADKYKGDFTLFNLFGETSSVSAPNPEDVHVTKFKPTLKTGYYKEENPASRIVVSAKIHGGEYISFN